MKSKGHPRSRSPAFNGIQTFDNDDQAAKHCSVLQTGHHYQKFEYHRQQEALVAPFYFTFFSLAFLSSWLQFLLHPGCFWLGFHFFFEKLLSGYMVHYIIECSIRVY